MSGRPRRISPIREGNSTRDEILDASAELFTTDGFAATTTRRIAESVGIQQASLYYHFKTKDDILDALLAMTIDQPLHYAALIADRPEAPVVRLYALALGTPRSWPRAGGIWGLCIYYRICAPSGSRRSGASGTNCARTTRSWRRPLAGRACSALEWSACPSGSWSR